MRIDAIAVGMVAACAVAWGAETYSGRLVDPSTKAGVAGARVELLRAGVSTSTDAQGAWSLEAASIVARGEKRPSGIVASLVHRDGRLRILRQGRSPSGRMEMAAEVLGPEGHLARSQATGPDTLVYSWNGRPFLRDTLPTLPGEGMLREFDTTVNPGVVHGYLVDARDGSRYRTVALGEQEWMAQNLAWDHGPNWCYEDQPENCRIHGRLYPWSAAMGLSDSCDAASCPREDHVVGICPDGWHLPSMDEWKTLRGWIAVQPGWDGARAGESLKAGVGWTKGRPADPFGFRALPSGDRYLDGTFYDGGDYGVFWSSTERFEGQAWHVFVTTKDSLLHLHDGCDKPDGFSVRCLRDR